MISNFINKILSVYSELNSKMSNIWFFDETSTFFRVGAEGNRDDIASLVVVKIHRDKINVAIISIIHFIFKILDLSCIPQKEKGHAFNV